MSRRGLTRLFSSPSMIVEGPSPLVEGAEVSFPNDWSGRWSDGTDTTVDTVASMDLSERCHSIRRGLPGREFWSSANDRMDRSDPCHYSSRGALDASQHGFTKSSCSGSRPPRTRTLPRIWNSLRSLGSVTEAEDSRPVGRKLPARMATIETIQSMEAGSLEDDDTTTTPSTTWEEERVELQEKVEALEQKLQTKQAVLQCLMLPSTTDEESEEDSMALLKHQVQQQALRIEELEQEQQAQEQAQADESELWEQLQEQSEKINRMEADHEFQMQVQQRRQNQLMETVLKLQQETKKLKETKKLETTLLQNQLWQLRRESEGYQAEAKSLRGKVERMEQDKQDDEIHLWDIAMDSISDLMELQAEPTPPAKVQVGRRDVRPARALDIAMSSISELQAFQESSISDIGMEMKPAPRRERPTFARAQSERPSTRGKCFDC